MFIRLKENNNLDLFINLPQLKNNNQIIYIDSILC